MNVQVLPIHDLIPYARNAKVHPKEQIDRIALQISKVGFLVPIIIDKNKVVIAGHGRLAAALALNMSEVPVVVADHLTEEQAMAFRIADNKVAESSWDFPLLAFELGTLERREFDLQLTGFNLDEAKSILSSLNGPSGDEAQKEGAKEFSNEGFEKFQHKCPKCNFEFNDPA